jgi:ferredoxin
MLAGCDPRAAAMRPARLSREAGLPMPARGGARWRPDTGRPVRAGIDDPDPGPTEPQAAAEACRCLMCGPCEECRLCTPTCEFVLGAAGRPGASVVVRLEPGALGCAAVGGGVRPLAAGVDGEACVACGLCAEVCPWAIPRIVARRGRLAAAVIDGERCRSCGLCAGACPAGAIDQPAWAALAAGPGPGGEAP